MKNHWLLAVLACTALAASAPARASDLSEIKDTQKTILERLDAQDKVLKDIQTKLQQMPAGGGRPQVDPNKVYEIALANSAIRGSKNAPVTLIEFSDFQCPFCGRLTPTLEQLARAYPRDVRIFFRHNPLPFHKDATLAAEAAVAAEAQGKFWQMHDKLFANQGALDRASLEKYAAEIGLDMPRFRNELDDQTHLYDVRSDILEGQRLGLTGTPVVFINGRIIKGAYPWETFQRIADAELAKKKHRRGRHAAR
jgi:protein-disulfide isomerase